MSCPAGACPPFSGARCRPCPNKSQTDSLSTFETEPQPTIWPTGFVGLGIPSQPQPSSERDKALSLLNEAYNAVARMNQSRVTSVAKTKIEEAEMWLGKARP